MPDYSTIPEDDLVNRLRSGDEIAFTEVYNRYWEKLLAIGYYHTRDKQTAEDIVHEVMIGLWTRRTMVMIQSLPAYLATAVKFAVFKSITRDKKRRELILANAQQESQLSIDDQLDARFMRDYLQGAIEQLPEKARLVFTLSRVEDLSIAEIAHKMDLSPKAVEYHMTKALRALKTSLQKIKLFFI